MTSLVGYLGHCGTPYCGSIDGYFCVKCHHYVVTCRCRGNDSIGCTCEGQDYERYWASEGERPMLRKQLAEDEAATAKAATQ